MVFVLSPPPTLPTLFRSITFCDVSADPELRLAGPCSHPVLLAVRANEGQGELLKVKLHVPKQAGNAAASLHVSGVIADS